MSLALRRLALTLGWTLAFGVALYALDRFLFSVPDVGWQRAASVDAIPPGAGPVATPRYVPEALRWPPREVHYRVGDAPGFWLGLGGDADPAARLWIGASDAALPEALEALRGCVVRAREVPCPPGWQVNSFDLGGRVVYLLGDLPQVEMRRVLLGLRPHR